VDRRIYFVFIAFVFSGSPPGRSANAQEPALPSSAPVNGAVSYSRDIAAIILSACAPCHRPGQAAPFSLITYEDVRPRAAQIVQVVTRRQMPPWKPEEGFGDFADARRLTSDQIDLIRRWARQGFLQGDAASAPAPEWPTGWQLGTPDLIIEMPEPYTLAAGGTDVFRTFVVPIPTTSVRYVRALEFDPGSAGVVHHANIKIDRSRFSRRWDEEEPGPGYAGGGSRDARFPDGHFLGWTPGQSPRISPPDMSWRLDPGSDLAVEMHLMPRDRPETVRFRVALSFTDVPPSRVPYMLRLGRQDIDILPGDRNYVNADSFTLPVDVHVLSVQPHAHYLAREIRGFAVLPDGSRKDLIYIKDWDFHWQDVYRYKTPVALPRGTRVEMRYLYDNSAANRRNPSRPPRRVRFGQTSSSEMGSLWLQVLPNTSADLQALDRAFSPKMLRDDIAGNEKWLEEEPQNAQLRAELAACYIELGRIDLAVNQLEHALRIERTPGRYYDLGLALLQQRKFDAAKDAFARALDLKPGFAEAVLNLGVVAHAQSRLDEAIDYYVQAEGFGLDDASLHYNLGRALSVKGRHQDAAARYARTLELEPENAEAHRSLGHALSGMGRHEQAIAEYRKALHLEPDLTAALIELAWLLTRSDRVELRDPRSAVQLAERAAELTRREDAHILDVLAVAYIASGLPDRAIETAEAALTLASRSGDVELMNQLRLRLDFYRKQKR
jgi:tetratricopeptide (TPR) repeat protein